MTDTLVAPTPDAPTIEWNPATDPASRDCPFLAAEKLHEGPDVFWNTAFDVRNFGRGGCWTVTRNELQAEVLQNQHLFSSRNLTGFARMLGEDWPLVPIELDPPDHMKYRMLLNPLFSPAKINEIEEDVRAQAISLIEKVRADGGCEFMQSFGTPFPIGVFMRLMGLPMEERDTFLAWEDDLLHRADLEPRVAAARNIKQYLVELIARRRVNPTGDLVSFALSREIDGKPISDEAVLGICFLFFVGGLDTVAATLGFAFRALAEQPSLQRQLRADPSIYGDAVEELMRAFGVVTVYRQVTEDVDFHGVRMRKGDRVGIPLGLASRDDRVYDNPDIIDFTRANTRNISFSVGPHRCIGSHLARREIKIALEEWMTRTPEFRVRSGTRPMTRSQGVWGIEKLELVW